MAERFEKHNKLKFNANWRFKTNIIVVGQPIKWRASLIACKIESIITKISKIRIIVKLRDEQKQNKKIKNIENIEKE